MATTAMDMAKIKSISVLTISCLCSQITVAGDWQFSPSLFVDEIYSDNVELSKSNKVASFVSQLNAGVDMSYEAQYLLFDFRSTSTYAMYSHDHDIDKDYHTLNSQIRYMLWPNGISITASADISNQSRNAAQNALADIVNANTVQIENYNAGLAYNVENSDFTINSSLQYQMSESEDRIGEREGYIALLETANGKSARNIFWNISGNFQDFTFNNRDREFYRSEVKIGWISGIGFNPFIRYYDEDNQGTTQNLGSLESNSVGLGVRWLVTPRLYVDVSYNNPVGENLTIDGEVQDNYLDYAISWQPSQRTKISAGYSQRFYGDSYQFALTHQNRRLSNTIAYTEAVQTFTRNSFEPVAQGVYICPLGEVDDLSNCYLNDNQTIDLDNVQLIPIYDFTLVEDYSLSLNKSLSWSSTLTLPRTTFTLGLTGNERENLSSRLINTNSSATFSIKRDLSPKSSLTLALNYREQDIESNVTEDRSNRFVRASIDYNRQLNKNLKATFGISTLNRDSKLSYLNYDENRISFNVTKGF